jgi:hypothetical protein
MANGWCKTREGHDGRFDHEERETCVGFEAESVVMERLTAEAREHDGGVCWADVDRGGCVAARDAAGRLAGVEPFGVEAGRVVGGR